jgi:PKD repeat protein
VTDFLGTISSDTIVVHPPFNVNKPVTSGLLCAGNTLTWATNYSVSNFTFLWQDGSVDSFKNITQAGNYAVAISDLFGCVYYSDTLSISMDNFPLTATLGNDTTLCAGNLISLQVGASETANYFWNGTSASAQSPFLSVNTSGTYTLEAINTNSCIAKDTIGVIVSGQAPLADFAFASEFVCLGTPISFVDESAPIGSDFIVQWNWNMGNGVALTGQNQNYEFPAPGTYTVQLYVESVGGCGAFHWDTLEIFANPTAAFTSVGHCSGQDVVFTSGSYANGAPLSAHYWSFGMLPPNDPINFSTLQEAMRTYLSAGSYTVSLLVTDTNSCTDEALATLVIDPTPIVQFAVEDACVAAEVPFTDESSTANFSTYLWDFGNNGTSLLTNPTTSYATPGSRTVSLVITSPEGCVGTRQESLMVHDNPVAEMDLGPYCKGTYTDVSDISTVLDGSIASSYWIFNQVDTVYGSDVHYIFQTLGQQQIVLNTISNYGCKTTLNEFIEVTAELNAAFGVGTGTTAAGAPFNFTNLSTGSAIYLWNFGDNTISNAVAPEHTYGEAYIDSSLQVALYALNVEGCVDTAYQTLSIERAKIDLELSYLYVQKQNDWNIIGVKMTNRGTTPLKKIQLFLETDKGFLFQETWTGNLKPLEDTIYVFGAKPVASISDQYVEESFVCVNAIGYDLFQEEETILWNNYLCRNIEGENVILKPVYPNPVHGEMTVELIVSKDSEVSIQLFDATGKTAITLLPEQILSEGNYSYTVNTAHLSSGTYFLRMVTKENVVMEKISFQ